MKRLLVLLMVCALCAAVPMIALAKAAPPPTIEGYWSISGTVTISASFPNILTLTLTLPKAAILEEEFYFVSGYFSDYYDLFSELLYTETSKGAYNVVGFSGSIGWVQDFLNNELVPLLESYGIDPTLGKVTESFTGQASSATKCTANISVVIPVIAPISGKVTISATLTGTRIPTPSEKVAGVPPTPHSLAKALVESWSQGLVFQKLILPLFGFPVK
jgi:hypothetical protein